MTKRKIDKTMSDHIKNTKQPKNMHVNNLLEDGALKYDFMTSLENIAIAKISSDLWMNQNTQQEIVHLFHGNIRPGHSGFSEKWRQIENNVVTKVSKLLLANPITKKLKNVVPLVGNSILNWIKYNDLYILNTSQYCAVNEINNIKWTTRGKIDYAQTAINILANEDSCLSDDHKYKLACTYCLEDEIAVLAPNVVDQYYLYSVDIEKHPMVYFWTAHITGDDTKLYKPTYYYDNQHDSNMNINEYIIRLLINNNCFVKRTFNEVPIKYMWEKLSKEDKSKNITSLIRNLGNQDLRYSLLSNLNYDQQQKVFKECSGSILYGMFDDWLWGEYFLPTALHILDIMHPKSYLFILQKVNVKMRENSSFVYNQYKPMFKQLWQESSKQLKDFVFKHDNGRSFEELVLFSLSWNEDMDIIKLIFNDLNTRQKKFMIFRYCGIRHCAHLIQSDRWDLLELFTKYTLSSEQDINQLKQRLVKTKGREIAIHFLEQEALDKIEYFMNWALTTEKKINQFRQSLAYTKCQATLESVIANNKVDFTELENHFKWCAKGGDIEVINQFKAEVPKLYPGKELISSLIESDKYELLDQVLNWCFLDNQQIAQFKSNMYRDDKLSCFVRELIYILIEEDNSFQLLDKFIDWSFTNEQEVQEFKMWMLYPQEDSYSVCTDFLIEYQFELANKCIEKCIASHKDIAKFKKKLMLSTDDIKYIFDGYFEEKTQDDLPLLIKWFNPSKETAAEFKTLFVEQNWPVNFYKLLDEFVYNPTSAIEDSVQDLKES